ncbi:hypothetical protein [Deinococcus cellulosilyticus]|uniref:Uncharacterized protein n=1 Tax=Deinococcus cellulosilyticus (strain DSM 18568 / NBRC 106333 / KACC 11606 / 5516J-15) TaxID=1223518 RepID=A0A511N7J6_DEIC1|nr:hypothetical protein [Deinococcus cellulosilyticus]GEM48804.1 hypothetical protein DC3_44390 [Deinococcus cellulosilyticus NBRC 106333 = KACC 11606]
MDNQLRARCTRLLEIPEQIEAVRRLLTAQRAELRKVRRKLDHLEAQIRLQVPADLKNEKQRDAWVLVACEADQDWSKAKDREESLQTAIDKYLAEHDVLDHERKSLRAVLEREYADIIETALNDRALVEVLSRKGGLVG